VQQAIDYFGNRISLYVDTGPVPADQPASRIVRLSPEMVEEWLR